MTDTQKQPASVPESVRRLMKYAGKQRREVNNPCITANEAIEIANHFSAYGREQAQQWIPVGTAHYQVAGGTPGIQWYVKPNGTIVYVKEPPTC